MAFHYGSRSVYSRLGAVALFIFLSLPGFISLLPVQAAADSTILIYHRFGESRYPTTNVVVDRFAEQMEYLHDNGYQVVSLAAIAQALQSRQSLPDKTVAITIDDGARSIYDHAWPILKGYGFPFTVFLHVEAVDRGYRNFLTWDQVRQMRKAGVDFQDHSYSHHHLAFQPKHLSTEAEYRAWIRADLVKGAAIMTRELGVKPTFLAIPYGEYTEVVLEEAAKAGYEAVFSQDPGSISGDTPIRCIPREPILGYEWASMEHFKMVLERVDLPIDALIPAPVLLADPTPKRFGARLLYPHRYYPDSLGIYISELGWQPAVLDGDFLSLANDAPLARQINRVAVSGRERESGKTAIRFWMLVQ